MDILLRLEDEYDEHFGYLKDLLHFHNRHLSILQIFFSNWSFPLLVLDKIVIFSTRQQLDARQHTRQRVDFLDVIPSPDYYIFHDGEPHGAL